MASLWPLEPAIPVQVRAPQLRVRPTDRRTSVRCLAGGRDSPRAEARDAIARSKSWTEALRRLDYCPAGGNPKTLKKYASIWGISTDHFDPYAGVMERVRKPRLPLDKILVEHSTYSRSNLEGRLYEEGLKEPRCELCGQGEIWRGRHMSMILDHKNGVRDDNRLENLRMVCPNCAATLDTHCGRSKSGPPPLEAVHDAERCSEQNTALSASAPGIAAQGESPGSWRGRGVLARDPESRRPTYDGGDRGDRLLGRRAQIRRLRQRGAQWVRFYRSQMEREAAEVGVARGVHRPKTGRLPRRVSTRKLRVFGVLASGRFAKVSAWRRKTPHAPGSREGSGAGQLAREVSSLQASLLGKLHEEMAGGNAALFAAAAQKLAEEFGSVTATAIGTLWERDDAFAGGPRPRAHPSLYRPGQMRRRLDQLLECHRRYEQPFALVVFDVEGPGTRDDDASGGRQTALAVVGAALSESVRLVDETFRLEEDALCVMAPGPGHGRRGADGGAAAAPARRPRAGGRPADRDLGRRRRLSRARQRRRPAPPQGRRGDVAGPRGGPARGRRRSLQDR